VHLKGMTSVTSLELADTQMTNAGLKHLKVMNRDTSDTFP